MTRISALWRHPIKAHGREITGPCGLDRGADYALGSPLGRGTCTSQGGRQRLGPLRKFQRGAKVAQLMAIEARLDEAAGLVTLSHPDRPDLTFDPDADEAAFLEWVRPLMPADRAQSTSIVHAPDRGMTDTDFPSISLLNTASHADVCDRMGRDLSLQRWRGNIHLDGLAPWPNATGSGAACALAPPGLTCARISCAAWPPPPIPPPDSATPTRWVRSNPTMGHQEFGVYGVVTQGGTIAVGDTIEVI